MSKIAVVMSVYAGDNLVYLKSALRSLYGQEMSADIFIQMDGPVDDEVSRLLFAEFESGRIEHIGLSEENEGLAKSLNTLLKTVMLRREYEYIARMDADDISLPFRFRKQYDFMQNNRDVDVVGGYIEEFSEDLDYSKIVHYPTTHKEMYRFFAKRVPLAHVTAFFRRTFFEKTGSYPTTSPTNEGTLLWMKGFKAGCRFANIPETLVQVRVSKAFFSRRGGMQKAWSDFKDRVQVINTLGYNKYAYLYALALFMVNIAPPQIKKFFYKRLR